MSSLIYKLSFNVVPINCVWSKYSGCVCCECEKNWFLGTIDTSPQKWYAATTAIDIFVFIFILSKLCVCVGGGGEGGQKHLYPPCPPSRGNAVPYLSKIYGKPSTGGRNSFLKLNHLFKFFEVLSLVFACICNEND